MHVDEWVHPDHRFRIASVSKTITAAAVMKLVDSCGLNLTDLVFGQGRILGTTYGQNAYHARELAIAVSNLLDHTTGWNPGPNQEFDGVWNVTGDDPDDAIDWQLDNTDPANPVGTVYNYLNTGYLVAARVIERFSGRSYERFVKEELLAPSCVSSMQIGENSRSPNEVVYYTPGSFDPYNLSPSRMDAHGGWIARPIDLLLFLRRIDGDSTNQADLLQSTSVTAMQTPTLALNMNGNPPNYGFGLMIPFQQCGPAGWGHNGGMAGTAAFLVYRNDGMAFAVTCNTDTPNDVGSFGLACVINTFLSTLTTANAWPNYDLFPCNISPGSPPGGLVGREVYVDLNSGCPAPNGDKDCFFFFGGAYPGVTQALSAISTIACTGERLFIRTGSYNETPLFDRPMTVRSYDGPATIGQ